MQAEIDTYIIMEYCNRGNLQVWLKCAVRVGSGGILTIVCIGGTLQFRLALSWSFCGALPWMTMHPFAVLQSAETSCLLHVSVPGRVCSLKQLHIHRDRMLHLTKA